MRILIATPLRATQPGGPGQYGHNLALALHASGHKVETIAFEEVSKFPSGIRHILLFFRACSRLRSVDGIIILDTVSIALPLTLAATLFRKKNVIRVGGDFVWEHYVERTGDMVPLSRFYRSALRLSLKERLAMWLQKYVVVPRATAVAFSTAWQRDIWEVPYGLRRTRTTIVENAYAPSIPGRVEHAHAPNQIVWVGRGIALKNTDVLDRVMEDVRRVYPDVAYRKCSGLPHDEVLRVLAESRALVIPSISEVSPNLALEALALGIPVVLTAECGLKAVLGDAVTWIHPESPDDIAAKIGHLMTAGGYTDALARARSFRSDRTYRDVARELLSLLA